MKWGRRRNGLRRRADAVRKDDSGGFFLQHPLISTSHVSHADRAPTTPAYFMLLVNWLRTDGPVVAQKIVGSVATPAFAALHKRAQTTASLAPFGTVLTHPAFLPTENRFRVLTLWLALVALDR